MAITPHLGLTLVEQAQAQKEVTVNMALTRIDALLNTPALDKDLTAPPTNPQEGDVYIVASPATDAWTGKEGQVAYFEQDWQFIAPNEGLQLWVQDEGVFYVYTGSVWVMSASGGGEGGEANTGANANGALGGVFKEKSAATLVFNNLVAGSNISITGGGSGGDIVISSTGGSGGGGATALNGLSDVELVSPSGGQTLVYQAGSGEWQNSVLGVSGGGTGLTSVAVDCLLRGNGTGNLQVSGVKLDAADCISGFGSVVKKVAAASYSLLTTDTGKVIECDYATSMVLTLPNNLPQGFTVTIVQMGAGLVTFTAATGATYHNRSGHNKTAGQFAAATLYVSSNNDGSSATYILAGDLA